GIEGLRPGYAAQVTAPTPFGPGRLRTPGAFFWARRDGFRGPPPRQASGKTLRGVAFVDAPHPTAPARSRARRADSLIRLERVRQGRQGRGLDEGGREAPPLGALVRGGHGRGEGARLRDLRHVPRGRLKGLRGPTPVGVRRLRVHLL